jgi:hypothetical protein
MSQKQTYDKCKHYGYKKCPHIKDAVMQRSLQETPEYYGKIQILPHATDDEINTLCNQCNAFTLK